MCIATLSFSLGSVSLLILGLLFHANHFTQEAMSSVVQLYSLMKDYVRVRSWQRIILDRLQGCFPNKSLLIGSVNYLFISGADISSQGSLAGIWKESRQSEQTPTAK